MSTFEDREELQQRQKEIDARRAKDKRRREIKNTENLGLLVHHTDRIATVLEREAHNRAYRGHFFRILAAKLLNAAADVIEKENAKDLPYEDEE